MTDNKLKYSQLEILQLIMNNTQEIIWATDLDYCLLFANKAFQDALKISGGKEMQIGEKVLSDDYSSNFNTFWRNIYDRCFKNETFDIISEVPTINGLHYIENSLRPLTNENGIICGAIITSRDITQKKNIEIELLKAKENAEANEQEIIKLEKRNKAILDTIPDLMFIVDNNGTFKDFHASSTEKLYTQNLNFIGKSILHVLPEPVASECLTIIQNVAEKETVQFFEYTLPFQNGDLQFEARIIPYITDHVFLIVRDVTDKKAAEHELQRAKEKAEESDRLKTAFLQNMSHEIRTPLNAISGFSGMLNKPELSEEKRKSFVSIIQNSSKQLISIVTDILTISALETKQEKPNIDKVCINNIIVDLLAIFKQQAQNQNISLYAKQQLSDKQSEIYTDKTKITQILTNLLTNALKFTHEGFIEFGYNLKDSELEFYVKDSGIGIKPEFHEKIFERFRQADKSINKLYGGTGLGLAISKAFAELLGGKIWVQSELEKGSTFYFTIPYKPVNEIDKTTTPTKQNENFRTVLVAEDEEYNFLFIEELLIDMDLKLIHAKDGKETVEIFKANPNIDLILMDIKMPIMSGHEAAKIIKELKPDLPIVAQSAYALENERAKYEGIFDDYLTKPINEDDLKQMVMKYIDIKK